MLSGTVFDVKKFSIHDGPGIRTTVFFKGCPLHCWWCHNPESQSPEPEIAFRAGRCIGCGACLEACPQGAIRRGRPCACPEATASRSTTFRGLQRVAPTNGILKGETISTDRTACIACGACAEACYAEARQVVGQAMTVAQVMAEIERDAPFYEQSGGGVTFSGGEPLSQPEILRALLEACWEKGFHTALDTCGYAPWEVLDRLRRRVDLFLYDLKLMDDAQHQKFTGVSNELILANLQALVQRGHEVVLRLPVIPGVNDGAEQIRQVGAFAADLDRLRRVDLLPYHPTAAAKYQRFGRAYQLAHVRAPSHEHLAEIAQILGTFDLSVTIGG